MRNLIIVLALFATSCITINAPDIYNGYNKLTKKEKKQVAFLDEESRIVNLNNEGQVVAINGIQLQEYATEIDSLLIYIWAPNCTGKGCVLISSCQDYCNSKGYKLAVVAEYYDMQVMNIQNVADIPILVANHNYYNKYFARSNNKRLIEDLLVETTQKFEIKDGRYLLLSRGELVRQVRFLD